MKLAHLQRIYDQPFFELLQQGRDAFLRNWKHDEVQLCTLLSIKTGGCSEDCGYCSQSAHHKTGVQSTRLLPTEEVLPIAQRALENGSTRFCMGAAWRGVRDGDEKFEQVLGTIREVSKLGMEVCVTLGNLSPTEARRLKEAGVTAYNHNIDTSPEFYPQIVSTHTFEDRVNTIRAVQEAGMSVCCGGIIGMGETELDRLKMLEVLTGFDPPPESVPINCLMAMPGTPLENQPPVEVFELIRLIATTRIALPKAKVRLSAGRSRLSREAQALCFFAGANSIFYGDKLLTAENPGVHHDRDLLRDLNLVGQAPLPRAVPETACSNAES
jgi:biotin synthase